MAYQKQRKPASEDYCAYVTKMERKTSMCEGPHFPNFANMFKEKKQQNKKQQNHKVRASQGNTSTTSGLFGRSEHIEYEISETICEEKDVEVDTGGYVKYKHQQL